MASSSIAPIFLRAALAVTFLWAGFGKVLETMPVSGVEAAALANMGVVTPEVAKPVKPASTAAFFPSLPILALVQPPVVSEPKPDQAPPPPAAKNYSAADFPQPIQVRRLHGITLMVLRAASPHTDEQGTPRTQLLPSRLGDGNIPVYMAWAAALTENIAGLFVMVGLLTRVSALALAATMVMLSLGTRPMSSSPGTPAPEGPASLAEGPPHGTQVPSRCRSAQPSAPSDPATSRTHPLSSSWATAALRRIRSSSRSRGACTTASRRIGSWTR
jgi:uncharacterized membrane protein YphA (DoxX/SURF4 family)